MKTMIKLGKVFNFFFPKLIERLVELDILLSDITKEKVLISWDDTRTHWVDDDSESMTVKLLRLRRKFNAKKFWFMEKQKDEWYPRSVFHGYGVEIVSIYKVFHDDELIGHVEALISFEPDSFERPIFKGIVYGVPTRFYDDTCLNTANNMIKFVKSRNNYESLSNA